MFPNVITQAGGDAGRPLLGAGLLNILKLLDGLALVLGVDKAVNGVHVEIAVAFIDHVFISPQATR